MRTFTYSSSTKGQPQYSLTLFQTEKRQLLTVEELPSHPPVNVALSPSTVGPREASRESLQCRSVEERGSRYLRSDRTPSRRTPVCVRWPYQRRIAVDEAHHRSHGRPGST